MTQHPAIAFLNSLFLPGDLICLQLIHQKSRGTAVRFLKVEDVNDEVIRTLQEKNADGFNVYFCPNAFVPGATRRKKEFIGEIRTAFIEIDNDAIVSVDNIDDSVFVGQVPEPSFITESSPGKRQIFWGLRSGFTIAQLEALNRSLLLRFGGDPACSDVVRVLRLPNFENLKYDSKPLSKILVVGDGSRHSLEEFKLPLQENKTVIKADAKEDELRSIATFLEKALDESGIDYEGPRAWGSTGYLWELSSCVWSSDHTTGESGACIILMKSGAISYSCRHSSCMKNHRDWLQFRELIETRVGHKFAFAEKKDWSSGVILGDGPYTDAKPPEISKVTGLRDDMSDSVFSGRLGEICQTRLIDQKRFPIAYAWPALLAAAGVMVPPVPTNPDVVTAVDPMTNSFTALVGPVHSGKSQAINWANGIIGLPREMYSEVRAGSSESLLRKLMGMKKKGTLMRSLLIDLDEWAHLFAKASIESSSFATFLQTAFYKNHVNVVLGGGFEVDLTCALTLVGGIVEDDFGSCFGARSMGGLHDRFVFGLCPQDYNFMYRPFEGKPEKLEPTMVAIDKDVWDMVAALRKETGAGREAEHAVRVAHICASYDGRITLHAKDCEASVRAFVADQLRVRDILRPNEGVTNDAACANEILLWMRNNAPNGELVPERRLQHGIRRQLSKLGPGVFRSSVTNLMIAGMIVVMDDPTGKVWGGRRPKLYQLCVEEKS